MDTRAIRPPDKVAAPIYQTVEYREWRAEVIRRSHGWCQHPLCSDPFGRSRLYADHIRELRDSGEPFDLNNGMALCAACHQRKTLAERAKRMGLR
jgi:5-methylcytosine-specific restriction enzyme A